MLPAPCAPLARARDGRRFLAALALPSSSSVLPSPSPSDASEPAFITTATLSLTAIDGSSSALVSWGGASSAPKLAVTFSWLSRFRLAFLPGVLSPPGEAGGLALGLGMSSSGVMCGGVASASPLASCSRCSRFARRIAELYLRRCSGGAASTLPRRPSPHCTSTHRAHPPPPPVLSPPPTTPPRRPMCRTCS